MPEVGVKYDNNKLRYDLIEPEFLEGLAKILSLGAKKYSDGNWKNVNPFKDRYYAALLRHIQAWRKGELIDSESGESHLYHAACCLMFLDWGDKLKKEMYERAEEYLKSTEFLYDNTDVGILICDECGMKYGKPRGSVATYYLGFCDYCKTDKVVTEVRDYCYPKLPIKDKK
jgi:hypothetical protein